MNRTKFHLAGRLRPRCRSSHVPKPIELGQLTGPLRLLAFSDYRVQDIELLVERICKLEPQPDLILYAGDDINRFRPNGRNLFEELASKARLGLCAVAGNDDKPSVRRRIRGNAVFNIHSAPMILGDYGILGLEGAPSRHLRRTRHFLIDEKGIGYLLYSDREAAKHLNAQSRLAKSKNLIIVSHTPPKGVLDKAVRFSLGGRPRSIGSNPLAHFLRANRNVVLVVCGHVHLCGGMQETIGKTLIVNVASHDDEGAPGRFAVVDLQPGLTPNVEWHEVREASLVPGVGPATAERLRALGIISYKNLAEAPIEILRGVPGWGVRPETVKCRAIAKLKGRVMLTPAYNPPIWASIWPSIFLDIETNPTPVRYVWLIGLIAGEHGEYVGLFADTPRRERKILKEFLDFTQRFPNGRILTCSGSRFEQKVLKSRLSQHGLDASVCDRIEDLSFWIQSGVALPGGSYKVKEVGASLGYSYKHPDLDGLQVASLYEDRFLRLKSGQKKKQLACKLLEYNEDDVRCLPFILRAVERLESCGGAHSPPG